MLLVPAAPSLLSALVSVFVVTAAGSDLPSSTEAEAISTAHGEGMIVWFSDYVIHTKNVTSSIPKWWRSAVALLGPGAELSDLWELLCVSLRVAGLHRCEDK